MRQPNEVYDDGLLDITGAKGVEIVISPGPGDTLVVHVNTEHGARLRICRIEVPVTLTDGRTSRTEVTFTDAPAYYSHEEACAWAAGYNQAKED